MRVEGVETLDYLDNLKNRERFTEQGDAITFESEVSSCLTGMPGFFHCHLSTYMLVVPQIAFFGGKGGQIISQYTNKNCYY